jgi:hypothetical protein
MLRKIFSYIVISACALPALVSCSKNDDLKQYFTSTDVSESSLKADKANVIFMFSTDGGKTFVDFPQIGQGQSYQMKVVDRTSDGDFEAIPANCLDVDWSASDPKPSGDLTTGIATFVMKQNNKIVAKVVNHLAPYNASSWTGDWGGDEVGSCCGGTDANTITQDGSDPNKFIMDNFWGDGVDAYIVFTPSTSLKDQIVTLPEQTTSEGGVAVGEGTYDQCAGTFSINTSYTIGGHTYQWVYNFHR